MGGDKFVEMDLAERFSARGIWWLPGAEEQHISGELVYDPSEGIHLELEGILSNEEGTRVSISKNIEVLHGITILGERCSLFRGGITRESEGTHRLSTQSLFFNEFAVGKTHIDSENTEFNLAKISVSDFDAWMARSPFSHDRIKEERISRLSYKLPEQLEFDLNPIPFSFFLSAEISHTAGLNYQNIRYSDFLLIRTSNPSPIKDFHKLAHQFSVFLSLFTGRYQYIHRFEVCTNETYFEKDDVWDREYSQIYYKQYGTPHSKAFQWFDIPFRFSEISEDFPKLLGIWFEESDELRTIYQIFFSTLVDRRSTTEYRFLALIQALECYDRSQGSSKYLSVEDYEIVRTKLCQAIPNDLPRDLKDALRSRIRFGNEWSLRKRLTNLIQSVPNSILPKIITDPKNFIARVVETRNYLTHRDPILHKDSLTSFDLLDAADKLQLLVRCVLLLRIGMKAELIANALQNHQQFRNTFS